MSEMDSIYQSWAFCQHRRLEFLLLLTTTVSSIVVSSKPFCSRWSFSLLRRVAQQSFKIVNGKINGKKDHYKFTTKRLVLCPNTELNNLVICPTTDLKRTNLPSFSYFTTNLRFENERLSTKESKRAKDHGAAVSLTIKAGVAPPFLLGAVSRMMFVKVMPMQ